MSEMIRIPDTNFSNFMCTDYRKPVVDPFYQELMYRKECCIDPDQKPDIGIMMHCWGGYPYERVSDKRELRLLPEFEAFRGKKIDVSEYMLEIDLQIFRSLSYEYMFYEKNCNLLHHPLIEDGWFEIFEERYIKDRAEKSCFIENELRRERENWSILPVNAFDLIEDSGLIYENKEKMIDAKVSFVPFLPAVADERIVGKQDLYASKRPYDCFLAGSLNAFVYPFRYIAFKKIRAVAEAKGWVLAEESRTLFKSKAEGVNKKFQCGEISKKQLDLEVHLISQMQYADYFEKASKAKLAITCSSVFGYPLKKYFEYMASGCVIVGNLPKNAGRYGLKHMENVFECEVDEIEEAVDFLLKNESIRLQLATNALKLVKDKYTMKARVDLFFQQIYDISDKYL